MLLSQGRKGFIKIDRPAYGVALGKVHADRFDLGANLFILDVLGDRLKTHDFRDLGNGGHH